MLKIAFHKDYFHPVPNGHRFPMEKYELLPQQLIYEGTVTENAFFEPGIIDKELLLAVHTEQYVEDLLSLQIDPKDQRKTGFIHSEQLIRREQIIMEGTRKAAEYALKNGVAMNISGGTHHAYSNKGEGFCLLNDNAIAAKWLLKNKLANKVLIIDLDVHQGDGTAEIFKNTPEVFTFSMHGQNNYPLKKQVSDLDVALTDGIKDDEYLYLLEKNVNEIFQNFTPDFIFFQSGVDILETDKLGKLNLSIAGCKKRDEFVCKLAKEVNVPIVASMGGGYSKEIKHIVEAHSNTFRVAQDVFF